MYDDNAILAARGGEKGPEGNSHVTRVATATAMRKRTVSRIRTGTAQGVSLPFVRRRERALSREGQ